MTLFEGIGWPPTPEPSHFLFFLAAFFLVAFLAADVLVFALAAAFFFGAALGLGMDFGLHSKDRVVARRPQLSQKYFSSSRLGKQTCRGSDAVCPQNSQTAKVVSSNVAGLHRCPFWVVVFPQVVHMWSREVDAFAMIPSFSFVSGSVRTAVSHSLPASLLSAWKWSNILCLSLRSMYAISAFQALAFPDGPTKRWMHGKAKVLSNKGLGKRRGKKT